MTEAELRDSYKIPTPPSSATRLLWRNVIGLTLVSLVLLTGVIFIVHIATPWWIPFAAVLLGFPLGLILSWCGYVLPGRNSSIKRYLLFGIGFVFLRGLMDFLTWQFLPASGNRYLFEPIFIFCFFIAFFSGFFFSLVSSKSKSA